MAASAGKGQSCADTDVENLPVCRVSWQRVHNRLMPCRYFVTDRLLTLRVRVTPPPRAEAARGCANIAPLGL
jgi:hypothetical protein